MSLREAMTAIRLHHQWQPNEIVFDQNPPPWLEKGLPFREAATRWAGDPEYQEKVAQGYYANMRGAKAGTGGDPLLEQLYLEAEKLYSDSLAESSDAGDINFRRGDRAYAQGDYVGARGLYLEVGLGSDIYEKARVKAGLCLYKQKDFEPAKREFVEYIERYVNDPTTKPTGGKKRQNRQEALAMAVFYP